MGLLAPETLEARVVPSVYSAGLSSRAQAVEISATQAVSAPVAAAAVGTFVVNSVGDAKAINKLGQTGNMIVNDAKIKVPEVTLRSAIEAANVDTAPTEIIDFDIPKAQMQADGTWVIAPGTPLDPVKRPTTIDGSSQSNHNVLRADKLLIVLNGSNKVNGNGLDLTGGGGTVKYLTIENFKKNGVVIRSKGGDALIADNIGTDATGTKAQGNMLDGVRIDGVPNNTIGGTNSDDYCVISSNVLNGVRITGQAASGNMLVADFIGTDITGLKGLGNGKDGLLIDGAPGNMTSFGNRNPIVLSDNGTNGVEIREPTATGNMIQGAIIGASSTRTEALGNNADGVRIEDAPSNLIGGLTDNGVGDPFPGVGVGDLITANTNGVYITNGTGTSATGNKVQGDIIGTDAAGAPLLTNLKGVLLERAGANNLIGGGIPNARNIISNNGIGVSVVGTGGTVIQGNYIGTDINGANGVPNTLEGVALEGAGNTLVGGPSPFAGEAPGNVISSNGIYGIVVAGSVPKTLIKIQGNIIGLDVAGDAKLPNGFAMRGTPAGVALFGRAMVGGPTGPDGNIISGNQGDGVIINGITGAVVQSNFIGVNAMGNMPLGNTGNGIALLNQADTAMIGGASNGPRVFPGNLIGGNGKAGIFLGLGTNDNTIVGNRIGVNIGRKDAPILLGNTGDGIESAGGLNNTIGGAAANLRNVISANGGDGIAIRRGGNNLVQGNSIGTDVLGEVAVGNSGNGVLIGGASGSNTIGGTIAGQGNTIANNKGNGVRVESGNGNAIRQDSIFANGDKGIALSAANNANADQAAPQKVGAASIAGNTMLVVKGTLTSPNTGPFVIEIFDNGVKGEPTPQGKRFIGQAIAMPNNNGYYFETKPPINGAFSGHMLTLTATDAMGNTSEFTDYIKVP